VKAPLFSDALPDIGRVEREARLSSLRAVVKGLDEVISGAITAAQYQGSMKFAVRILEDELGTASHDADPRRESA